MAKVEFSSPKYPGDTPQLLINGKEIPDILSYSIDTSCNIEKHSSELGYGVSTFFVSQPSSITLKIHIDQIVEGDDETEEDVPVRKKLSRFDLMDL